MSNEIQQSGNRFRPRRSLHFVPAGQERMFNKALNLSADSLILDLEDSVTPDNKGSARAAVCEWLQADFGRSERLVRINAQDTPWGREDLEAVIAACPDGIVVPKATTRAGVDAIDQIVSSLETQHGLAQDGIELILIASESPGAVFNMPQMAQSDRVTALSWGAEDLSTVLGARSTRDADGQFLEVFAYVRSLCLLSASAASIHPIDAVYADFKNLDGLRKECSRAAEMGYRGKFSIHPDQIAILNECFTPESAAVANARALLEAFEESQKQGRMAFVFDGRMVDAPHVKQAEQLLAFADALEAESASG